MRKLKPWAKSALKGLIAMILGFASWFATSEGDASSYFYVLCVCLVLFVFIVLRGFKLGFFRDD